MQFAILAAALSLVGAAVAEPSFHCDGQELCSTLEVKYCDGAVNDKIRRNDEITYGSPDSDIEETGECNANMADLGCGVFIRGGPECKFSGNQIWADYQEIRDEGCSPCGFKKYDDGCEVVVDYVSSCKFGE